VIGEDDSVNVNVSEPEPEPESESEPVSQFFGQDLHDLQDKVCTLELKILLILLILPKTQRT
jgi:hypothetical protein